MKNPVPVLPRKLYDSLKWVAQIVLPAGGAAYFALSKLWSLPDVNKVTGTIIVVDTFLGALLGLSSNAYNNSDAKFDGKINVVDTESKTLYDMEVHGDPADIKDKDAVTFKVVHKRPTKAKKAARKPSVTVDIDHDAGL